VIRPLKKHFIGSDQFPAAVDWDYIVVLQVVDKYTLGQSIVLYRNKNTKLPARCFLAEKIGQRYLSGTYILCC